MQAKFLSMIFLFWYNVCTVPGSYHIVADFVSDMIFALDRNYGETLPNAFLLTEHILMM